MLFALKKFVAFWMMPLSVAFVLLVVGACLLRHPRRARLGRGLLLGGIGLLLLGGNNYVSKGLLRPLEVRYAAIPELPPGAPLPPALAACRHVVVLGGGNGHSPGLSATNELSAGSLSRLVEAVRLLRVLPEAKLVVSGPGSGVNPTHATVLARAAQSLGIERSRITLIEQARDTEDEANHVRRHAGDAPVALVTSAWHMPRSMALFRGAGVSAVPCPADFRAHTHDEFHWTHLLWDISGLERTTLAVRERLGHLWVWLRGRTA